MVLLCGTHVCRLERDGTPVIAKIDYSIASICSLHIVKISSFCRTNSTRWLNPYPVVRGF
jgi:hypothetical protein